MTMKHWFVRSLAGSALLATLTLPAPAAEGEQAAPAKPAACAACGGCAAQADAAPNTLSDAERAAGWQLLFDGQSLDAWRGLGRPDGTLPAAWEALDGTLHKRSTKRPEGDLTTKRTWRNFELVFDWKLAPGGNSGVKYNVSEELSVGNPPKGHSALGFEYQVLDDERHPDRALGTHTTGALYDLIPPDAAQKRVNPPGQWNHSRVVFNGNHGEHWLNGRKVVEFELGTPEMNKALAASKWKKIKDFGTRRDGLIVIQDHLDEAWYRNVKIRELP